MNKGKFIVFEGGEGSGKTTMIELIYNLLIENGIDCIKTREPGGIKISEDIRSIILDKNNTAMDGRTEALLYAAARRQHLVQKVIPALESNKVVLCDRFIYSSLAYQGYAREIGLQDVYMINKFAIEDFMPDLNILFDLNPEVGLQRINKSESREINRLDLEKIDFHNKVREGYKILAKDEKNKIVVINAEKSIDEIFLEIKDIILKCIK